jgi:hypothetical protein
MFCSQVQFSRVPARPRRPVRLSGWLWAHSRHPLHPPVRPHRSHGKYFREQKERSQNSIQVFILADEAFNRCIYQYWISICRICMFLDLLDPDPLVRGTGTASNPDPSIIKQKYVVRKTLIPNVLWLLYDFYLRKMM